MAQGHVDPQIRSLVAGYHTCPLCLSLFSAPTLARHAVVRTATPAHRNSRGLRSTLACFCASTAPACTGASARTSLRCVRWSSTVASGRRRCSTSWSPWVTAEATRSGRRARRHSRPHAKCCLRWPWTRFRSPSALTVPALSSVLRRRRRRRQAKGLPEGLARPEVGKTPRKQLDAFIRAKYVDRAV